MDVFYGCTTSTQTHSSMQCRTHAFPAFCAVSPAAMQTLGSFSVFELHHSVDPHARESDLRPRKEGEHAGAQSATACSGRLMLPMLLTATETTMSLILVVLAIFWERVSRLAENPQLNELSVAAAAAPDDGESELYEEDAQE